MRQEIRDELIRRILEGKHRPGDRLLEMELATEFRTSQAPVREALRELEALGYVESAAYRGTRVREIPPTEMRDAFRIRALLEREAAERAGPLADDDRKRMRAAVEGIEQAVDEESLRRYVRHDRTFHRILVSQSGNGVLLRHWELLLVPTRILVVVSSGAVDIRRTGPEHRPILEALERLDRALAGRLVFEHINGIADRLAAAGPLAPAGYR